MCGAFCAIYYVLLNFVELLPGVRSPVDRLVWAFRCDIMFAVIYIRLTLPPVESPADSFAAPTDILLPFSFTLSPLVCTIATLCRILVGYYCYRPLIIPLYRVTRR